MTGIKWGNRKGENAYQTPMDAAVTSNRCQSTRICPPKWPDPHFSTPPPANETYRVSGSSSDDTWNRVQRSGRLSHVSYPGREKTFVTLFTIVYIGRSWT